jgi:hypothetical protein
MSTKKILSWKWSPGINEKIEKSYLKDKYKIVNKEIIDLVIHDGFVINETKREMNENKMNHRTMISNKAQNPFLTNNYLEDINNQEKFLTPKNSNNELEK